MYLPATTDNHSGNIFLTVIGEYYLQVTNFLFLKIIIPCSLVSSLWVAVQISFITIYMWRKKINIKG